MKKNVYIYIGLPWCGSVKICLPIFASAGDVGSFLGWEDTLEKGIATHLIILAWRIP